MTLTFPSERDIMVLFRTLFIKLCHASVTTQAHSHAYMIFYELAFVGGSMTDNVTATHNVKPVTLCGLFVALYVDDLTDSVIFNA